MIRAAYYALDDLYQRYIYERPNGSFRRMLLEKMNHPDYPEKARRLCDDGFVVLPSYFEGDLLRTMQEEFAQWTVGIPVDAIGRITLTEPKGVFVKNSAAFSTAAVDPYVLALVAYYWGKPVTLSMSYGFRLDPNPGWKKVGPFQWHHDANRKQVKVYVLLSDVRADGQRMDYIPGTHRLWHRFQRGGAGYGETRIPDEVALRYGPPSPVAGPAGSVIIFDTNGFHTGNQNMSARRDAWIFQYTAGRHAEPLGGIHPDLFRELTPFQRAILRAQNLTPSPSPAAAAVPR